MTDTFQRLMTQATELTRTGQLREATQAIQRALGAGAGQAPAERGAPAPGARQGVVLDGLTRVIDTPAPAANEAPAAAEPATRDVAAQGERWIDGSFTHQGRVLRYKLFLPPAMAGAPQAPRPIVLMLHGCTQGAADFAAGTQMNERARELGVAVVYPEQTQRANSQKCWNWFKTQHQQRGRGEPAALAALTQHLVAEHALDPSRVYVAGLSAGGAMADILAHCYPDVFAAVGVHSGLPHGAAKDLPSALSAMRSGSGPAASAGAAVVPPTIVFHGASDTTVHPRNGKAIVSGALDGRVGSDAAAPAQTSEGRSAKGKGFRRTTYTNAAGQATAEHWELQGIGHAWSGGSQQGSYTDPSGVDASAEMLRFFLANPRRATRAPG